MATQDRPRVRSWRASVTERRTGTRQKSRRARPKAAANAWMYSTAERSVSTLLIFLLAAPLGTCWRSVWNPILTCLTRFLSRSLRRATATGCCCCGMLYPSPLNASLRLQRNSSGERERCLFSTFDLVCAQSCRMTDALHALCAASMFFGKSSRTTSPVSLSKN